MVDEVVMAALSTNRSSPLRDSRVVPSPEPTSQAYLARFAVSIPQIGDVVVAPERVARPCRDGALMKVGGLVQRSGGHPRHLVSAPVVGTAGDDVEVGSRRGIRLR